MFNVKTLSLITVLVSLIVTSDSSGIQAQGRPFSLPFALPPGPNTWFLGQQHGNTSGAYNFGKYWYAAGQGLHFGIDFPAPCGTPVVAVADGIVEHVDNFSFGIRPHNIVLSHRELGYTSLYGHLYTKSSLLRGQTVKRGEVIAQTGDPDLTCTSRPHLHFEIRSLDYRTAYNPAALIDADWPMLASIGHFGFAGFIKDLYNPNQWQNLDSQPDVRFGGRIVNDYRESWPPRSRFIPPPMTLPASTALPIPDASVEFRQLTQPGCCSLAWWSPDSKSVRFWNGAAGELATVQSISVFGGDPVKVDEMPLKSLAADGQYIVQWQETNTTVFSVTSGTGLEVDTNGSYPRLSPRSQWLLWQVSPGDSVPGTTPPRTQIWIARPDGSERQMVGTQQGGSVYWLDDDRILFSQREPMQLATMLNIYSISSGITVPLLTAENIRNLIIAPGGRHITYYRSFQSDPNNNKLFILETETGATPKALPFFGTWRWRDSKSIFFIPYAPGAPMTLVLYNIETSEERLLTNPVTQKFSIANDDWSVSPDGQYVVFWSAEDYALWAIVMPNGSVG